MKTKIVGIPMKKIMKEMVCEVRITGKVLWSFRKTIAIWCFKAGAYLMGTGIKIDFDINGMNIGKSEKKISGKESTTINITNPMTVMDKEHVFKAIQETFVTGKLPDKLRER